MKYEPVDADPRDSAESERTSVECRQYEGRKISLRTLQIHRVVATILVLLLIFILPYTVYLHIQLSWHATHRSNVLGTDPSGFVPDYAGGPPRWMLLGKDDPYFVELDTFRSFEKTKALATKFKSMHGSYEVLIKGNYTDYVDEDGQIHDLPPIVTGSGRELYIIRGFYQMHCVTTLIEAYGYAVHGREAKWPPEHVAHCVNMVREAVTCLADAGPVSYVHEKGVGLVGMGQQMRCRDYAALWEWAKDPIRRMQYKNVAPEDEEDQFVEDLRK